MNQSPGLGSEAFARSQDGSGIPPGQKREAWSPSEGVLAPRQPLHMPLSLLVLCCSPLDRPEFTF